MPISIIQQITINYLTKVFPALNLQLKDRFVAITDGGVEEECRLALSSAIANFHTQTGIPSYVYMSDIPTGSAQDFRPEIEEKLRPATAILYHTSKSRSHCAQTCNFVLGPRDDFRPKARLISITNGFTETLLEGAVNENLAVMRQRIEKINALTRSAAQFHITTPAGTNLWVTPWPEMSVVDNGLIDQPGMLGNFPFGEGCSCAVKFDGTNGVLVSDGIIGGGIGQVDEPICMVIFQGEIVSMEGGLSKDQLAAAMHNANQKMPKGFHLEDLSSMLAEIAFGANSQAWRVKDGKKVLPPTSLEAEKAYDPDDTSIHIAHGANHAFGVRPENRHFNPVQLHVDHVLRGGVTVDMFTRSGEETRLIDNGRPIY
jgi:hypothetical protein